MTLKEIKDLIIFCKAQGVEYIEVSEFKASIPREISQSSNTPGEPLGSVKPAGLFDHLDGMEPDFTELPEKEDS